MDTYTLVDSGGGQKLEQFGPYLIARPASQAIWRPRLSKKRWSQAHAVLSREKENKWNKEIAESWVIQLAGIQFKLKTTDFGHLGIFPEHQELWKWIEKNLIKKKSQVLNLFAYSGGATLAAAKAGAHVCHLDASKGMVDWAKENAKLNNLQNAPIRWIVDDVTKFLKREIRREHKYDAIILDPPTFGRGKKGEVFKIEKDLPVILELCKELLSKTPQFIHLSCHTPGYTPTVLHHLLDQNFSGNIEKGEMLLENTYSLPSGTYARWTP